MLGRGLAAHSKQFLTTVCQQYVSNCRANLEAIWGSAGARAPMLEPVPDARPVPDAQACAAA